MEAILEELENRLEIVAEMEPEGAELERGELEPQVRESKFLKDTTRDWKDRKNRDIVQVFLSLPSVSTSGTTDIIKAKTQSPFNAHAINLYLVNITGSDERACIEEANHRAQNLTALQKLDSSALLSNVFVRSGRAMDLSILRNLNPFAALIDFVMPQTPLVR